MLISQHNGEVDARTEEFLLLDTDDSQRVRTVAGIDANVIFLQLTAESTAGNTELFRGLAAMTAAALEGADNHLLLHAVEIADRHGCRLT